MKQRSRVANPPRRGIATVGLLLLLLAIPLLIPTPANALTPTTPADGATLLTTHPTFTWTDTADHASSLSISRQPRTTPEGEFYDEDRVGGDYFGAAGTNVWAPSTALPAGTYWWNLWWNSSDYLTSGYTTPWSFTIPPWVRRVRASVGARWRSTREIDFKIRYTTNLQRARIRCVVKRKGRTIYTRTVTDTYVSVDLPDSATCSYRSGRKVARKTRLVLVATVTAGGAAKATRLPFRAL